MSKQKDVCLDCGTEVGSPLNACKCDENLNEKILKAVEDNHIWINALKCIKPSNRLKMELAESILEMLNEEGNLLPSGPGQLGKLTPTLYLRINKS